MSEDKLSVVLGKDVSFVKLPSGEQITLKPLTFNDLAQAEEYFGVSLDEWGQALKKIKNVIFLIFLAFHKTKTDLTVEQVGDLFTLENEEEIENILKTIMKKSGLKPEKNA